MQLLWFYIAVVLALSDILHTMLMWKVLNNFYIILGGLIKQSTHSVWQTWLAHELMEACFHFFVLSIVFVNPVIGLQAALIHFIIDVSHTIFIPQMDEIAHRALHFVIESLYFILAYGL